MAQVSALSTLLFLLFTFCVSANVVPRYALTSATSSATTTYTGAVVSPSAFSGSCPAIDQKRYASPYGVYLVECFVDHAGSDITGDGQVTASFQICLDQCASTASCVAITWMNKSGRCYKHRQIGLGKANPGAWGAKWISGPLPPAPVSSSTSSTTSSSTTAPAVVTTSTSKPPAVTTSSSSTSTSSTTTISSGPSSVSGGIESTFAGPTSIPGPAPVVLGPVTPPGLDRTNLALLTPQKVASLFYSGGVNSSDPTSTTGTAAKLSVTLQYLSIPLDHSVRATSSCSNGALTVSFGDAAAFAQAQSTWPSGTFILITAAPSCSADGQNIYFQASSVLFQSNSLTATASGTIVQLSDVFSDLGMDFGAIPATNVSSSTGAASAPVDNCGTLSNSTINGLPAVPCGPNFDQTLDNLLGFYPGDDASVSSVLAQIAPGASTTLQKRWSLKKTFAVFAPVAKAVATQVIQTVAPIVQKYVPPVVQNAIVSGASFLEKAVSDVVSAVASFLTGTFSHSLNIPINIVPPAAMLVSSPWGNQFKFYDYQLGSSDPSYTASDATLEAVKSKLIGDPSPVPGIELFCVNCGVTGNIQVTGSVSISATQGFYAGSIGMQGNMQAGLYVGVNGFYAWQKEMHANIISAGLPGFSIPEVVTLGPQLALDISATIGVNAVGQILVGASYSWPALSATLDVMNSANSQRSGFTPTITKEFDVYGDVTATASIGLPVTLSFGLTFFSGKWSKTVDIKDVPSLNAVAEFSITGSSVSSTGPGGPQVNNSLSINTNGCNGISWNVNLANEVDLDIGDSTTYVLWQWTGPPLAQGCIGRSVAAASSTTSSFPTVSSTSTTVSTVNTVVTTSTSATTLSSASMTQGMSSMVLYVSPLASSTQASQALSSTVLMISPLAATQTSQSASSTALTIAPLVSASSISGSPPSLTSNSTTTRAAVSGSSIPTDAATQTSSAGVPMITNSLTVNDTIDCSVDDGRNFTDAQGYVYKIQCHVDLPGDDMANEQAATFEQCLADCFNQQDHDCVGVVWVPSRGSANCNFKGDRNTLPSPVSDATYGIEVDSAVLISAPSCASLTCPSNDAQYCMSNGEMFKMSCEIAYMTNQLGSFNLQTLSECVDACTSGWPGVCNGVTFFPTQWKSPTVVGFPTTNCYPFAQGDNPVSYAQAAGGVSMLSRNARNKGSGLWKRGVDGSSSLQGRQASSTSTNVTYASVFDTTSTISLLAADDGNLFVSPSNATQASNTTESSFSFYGNTIVGDAQDRYLHYYPDNIAATGASRLRLAPWGSIPHTAALISLAPVGSGANTIFVAVDTLGNYYWMYACAISNQQNKVFLVNDATNGAGILQDPSLIFTITGGVVNDCMPLAMTAAGITALG